MKLERLLFGEAERLRHVQRFSTCALTHKESVAEHGFYVILYSLAIAQWAWERGDEAFQGACGTRVGLEHGVLLRATLHDLEEARTGDIYRPFKHSSPALTEALETAAAEEVKVVLADVFDDDIQAASRRLINHETWRNSKDHTVAGSIVAFADFLSAMATMLFERRLHNYTIDEHRTTLAEHLKTFRAERFEFLAPLVRQATSLMEDSGVPT